MKPVMDDLCIGDAKNDIEGDFDTFCTTLLKKLGPGSSQSHEAAAQHERIEICDSPSSVTTTYRPVDESCMSLTCVSNKSVLPAGSKGRPHHELVLSSPNLIYTTGDYLVNFAQTIACILTSKKKCLSFREFFRNAETTL